jgi:eukaryotic-like serine/threonine-protein kinase
MLFEGIQLQQYHIRRLIGRGGTGDVYLADDQRLQRQVALKVVQSEDPMSEAAREAMRLFQREAKTIANLNHPNILPLFDFGGTVVSGITLSYLVTPFCPEGSLSGWLRQRTGSIVIPPHDVQHIVRQAADALEYAHDNQIIHRDVKPSNFLVRHRKDTPDRPDLMLADFGVARLAQANINVSKSIRGTPPYMAPEQWNANPIPATDQYALAIMTYELLTGRPTFLGSQVQVMFQHIMVPPQPPSTFNAQITPSIDAVVLRALAKQAQDRYPSVSAFAYAFQQAVAELTHASPSSRITGSSPSLPTPSPLVQDRPNISAPPISPLNISPSNIPSPPISAPGGMESNGFRTVVYVSQAEALAGTERTVLIPGRQPVDITVPAGAQDGQVICLQNKVDASSPNTPKRDLVLTIAVTPPAEPSSPAISRPSRPSISEPAIIQLIPGLSSPRITWKTLSFIGLALLLLLVGVVALSPFGRNLGAVNAPNATATANASNATMQAVQGSVSVATATANAEAQASVTASAYANTYDPSMGHLKLQEALTRNSGSQWDEVRGSCTFVAEGYHVIGQATSPQMCIAHSNTVSLSDFTVQVQMNILKGTGGGILFRAVGSTAYYFRISANGYYALFVCAGTDCSKTLTNGFSSAITQGQKQPNVLAVVAQGNHIELYVNGVCVNETYDSGSLRGQPGVVAEMGSEVVFSDLEVWTT